VVEKFARHFGKSTDKLGLDHLRTYQAYLLKQRKLALGSVVNPVAALRFLFVRTLKRQEFRELLPYPRERQRLPGVLSKEEVAQLINSSGNLFQRTLLDGALWHGHVPFRSCPSDNSNIQIKWPNLPVAEIHIRNPGETRPTRVK